MDKRESPLITVKEAAAYLGIRESRLRSAIRKKEVRYVKFDRLVRFDIEDLEQWIKKSKRCFRSGGGAK